MTATPRPWKLNSTEPTAIMSESELHITTVKGYGETVSTQEANAALIVKAVNLVDQHEQIVKELVRFVEHYEGKEGQLGNGYARAFLDKAKDMLFSLGAPIVK